MQGSFFGGEQTGESGTISTTMDSRNKSGALILIGVFLAIGTRALSVGAVTLEDPKDFSDVQNNVGEVQGDIGGAMCGGWDFDMSVEGKIPVVTGAPGRRGIVFEGGKVKPQVAQSGLALREENTGTKKDGFLFPDSGRVNGFTTVCNVNECGNSFPYQNAFVPGGGGFLCNNPGGCSEVCNQLNLWRKRHMVCLAEWTEWDADGNPYPMAQWREDTSPCFNGDSGDWCRGGDESWVPADQVLQNDHPDAGVSCSTDELFNCCSDTPLGDERTNCLVCRGDGLQDPLTPGQDNNGEDIASLDQTGCRQGKDIDNGRTYLSFFRQYLVSYSRDTVAPHVPDDDASRDGIPVNCFGPYEEFDPKVRRTVPNDRHCVIDLGDEGKRYNRMAQTQMGKANYGQNSNLPDPAFPREPRDTLRDLWVNDFSAAFSLLNGQKLQESPQDNLFPLLQLDTVDLRATPQLDTERLYSSGSVIRSTDDTVSNQRPGRRTLTEWWQEQETQAHKLFTSPMLRLILPTPASLGLDLSDPLLTPKITDPSDGAGNAQNTKLPQRTIDLQIRSDHEDLRSEVSAYLEHALLLHVQEEPTPLVVPLASSVELRALAQGWLNWGKQQNTDSAQAKAQTIAEKLLQYAERIEQVRALRGELARYIRRLLSYQTTMTVAIGEWLQNNGQTWERYAHERDERLDLKPLWEEVQQKYRVFHDQANFPWCRNDRYTTPIYSLLDDWMPGPSPLRDLAVNIDAAASNDANVLKLPRLSVTPLPDLVYNFTVLRVSTGTVLLPVLKPIQIRLSQAILDPPQYYQREQDISEKLNTMLQLPDLPPVPTVFDDVLNNTFPTEVLNPASPSIVSFTPPVLSPQVEPIMRRMLTIFDGMIERYRQFWDSLTSSFDNWDCNGADVMPCVHVEMDLLERFTRIGARPSIQLKEDFKSAGPLRKDLINSPQILNTLPSSRLVPPTAVPPCPREDHSCQIFNAEKTYAPEGWRVEGIEENTGRSDLQDLRNRLRTETVPTGSSPFPYIVQPIDMLPSFDVPGPIPLSGAAGQQNSLSL